MDHGEGDESFGFEEKALVLDTKLQFDDLLDPKAPDETPAVSATPPRQVRFVEPEREMLPTPEPSHRCATCGHAPLVGRNIAVSPSARD